MLLLLAGSLLLAALHGNAAAYGERVYEANPTYTGTDSFIVHSGQSVSQSFVATETHILLNVTLRMRNLGGNADGVNITIRPDASGEPAGSFLSAAQVITGNAVGPVDVPFFSPPTLTKGTRYWIVAAHAGPVTEGYEWHHSNADTYAGGQAKINAGLGWMDPPSPTDMTFVTYGRELDANLTAGLSASPSGARPKDFVSLTVYFNNTGTQTAQRAWVNVTLPNGLAYVSDTGAAAGSITVHPNYTFDGVANGVRSFTVASQVAVGVEPGTVLVATASVEYLNATGVKRPGSSAQASILIGLEWKQLYLVPGNPAPPQRLTPVRPTSSTLAELLIKKGEPHDFDLNPALVKPFRVVRLDVILYLESASQKTEDLDVNLTLIDWSGVTITPVAYHQQRVTTNNFKDYQPFTFSFGPLDYTFPSANQIRLQVQNMGSSTADAFIAMNATAARSRLEMRTDTYVRVDALVLRDGSGPASVWSPKDVLVIRANVSDPFGATEIAAARINVTDPGGSLVVNYQSMTLLAADPASPPAWKLYEFTYGPPLANGTYRMEVAAIEGNGVVDVAEASALVRAPRFSLEKAATRTGATKGEHFTYRLWYNNTGTGPALRVWLNDTLPPEVTYLATSDPAAKTGDHNWTWTSVGLGSYFLEIEVRMAADPGTVAFVRNRATLSYVDEKGYPWPSVSDTADVTLDGPILSLTKTSNFTGIHANEEVVYRLQIVNSGDPAGIVWVNDTLPAGLTYVSDTAGSLGGTTAVSGNVIGFRFPGMPAGTTWTFDLTARASASLAGGSLLINRATLAYTNTVGALMPTASVEYPLTALAPFLSATLTFSTSAADPGDVAIAFLDISNVGNENAPLAWINVTLDPYLAYVNASAPAIASGPDVRFALSNVSVGSRRIFLNLSVHPTVPDGRDLSVTGTLVFTDPLGNLFPSVALSPDSVAATAPLITATVSPSAATIEAGSPVTYTIAHDNAGSGRAGDVWLNLSLPASFVYLSDTSDGTLTVFGSQYQWHWTDQAPGPKSFELELYAKTSIADRSVANLTFRTEFTDPNGNLRGNGTVSAQVTFIAPVVLVELTADRSEALPGATVTYTLVVRNVGSGTAKTLWLLDRVDERFEIVSYTARVGATGEPNLNWTFTDLGPAGEEIVSLQVRVKDGVPARTPITNVIEARFTNGLGTPIGYVRSVPVTITVAVDLLPLYYILAGGIGLGALAVLVVRRRHAAQIEDVFLVYRDGVLLYHLSRSLIADKDPDILSGMLTAVQEFVRDAFRYGERRQLNHLDFGDYKILIERGKLVYLAVVYSGQGFAILRKKVRGVLDRIETSFGSVLESWDGDMDKIIGTRDLIRDSLLGSNERSRRIAKIG